MSSNHSSAPFWQILSDQENALKAEMENLKKVKEWVGEIEEWKMRMKREMEELKTEKKEVEERLKVCEERYVLLERRVAHIEENVAYLAAMLLRNVDGTISPNKEVIDKSTTSSYLNFVGRKAWMDQNEMRRAFVNDPQLCMSAVCALYRHLISTPLSNDQFGVVLAKYLINGHPENKLNRNMSEISKLAVEDSTSITLKYSEQLFRIYSSASAGAHTIAEFAQPRRRPVRPPHSPTVSSFAIDQFAVSPTAVAQPSPVCPLPSISSPPPVSTWLLAGAYASN
nr:Extensin-1 like [Ipomoea batatas]